LYQEAVLDLNDARSDLREAKSALKQWKAKHGDDNDRYRELEQRVNSATVNFQIFDQALQNAEQRWKDARGAAYETDSWREPVLISEDEKFIAQNALVLGRYNDAIQFLRYKIQMIAPYNHEHPYHADFSNKCLEYRLTIVSSTITPTTLTISKFFLLCQVQEKRGCFLNYFMQGMGIISCVVKTKVILARMICQCAENLRKPIHCVRNTSSNFYTLFVMRFASI
jgi:hypothetical protein